MTTATKKPAAHKAPAEKSDDAKELVEQVVKAAEAASENAEDALDGETAEISDRDANAVDEPGMITVNVKTRFKDKLTGEVRNPGAALDVSQERYEEIMAAGDFVEKQ